MIDDAFEGGPTDLSFSDEESDGLFGQSEFSTDFSNAKDTSNLLQDFLKLAGDAQGFQSNYNSAGSRSAASRGALLLNYTA